MRLPCPYEFASGIKSDGHPLTHYASLSDKFTEQVSGSRTGSGVRIVVTAPII